MASETGDTKLPASLRIAQLLRATWDFPGRDTLLEVLLRPASRLDLCVRGTYGGGLRFEGNPAVDDNVMEMVQQRFSRPALSAVFDAALEPGAVLADVGANHGLYTLWGARCVGPRGRVHAFEPNPDVRSFLERNVALNGFAQVQVVGEALGAERGELVLYRMARASGRTSRYLDRSEAADAVTVPVTTLDAHFDGHAPPQLIKIDVEGMEHQVLSGARRLLASGAAPAVVFEAGAPQLEAAGTSYRALLELLAGNGGYRVWALQPRGLQLEAEDAVGPGSLNVLALRDDLPAHRRLLEKLRRVRFPANQNC